VSVHEKELAFFSSPILGEADSEGNYPVLWDGSFLPWRVCNQALNSFQDDVQVFKGNKVLTISTV